LARYRGPVCRLCRREGIKLFLKGERCHSEKCAIERRNFFPGQHGKDRKPKMVGYGIQLREKQKVRRIYGVLETQFRNTFEKATKMKGITGENLLASLERRLDSVIYRMGLATSRAQARQIVRHGHILVNGKKVDIPSYRVGQYDIVDVRTKSQDLTPFIVASAEFGEKSVPAWLEVVPSQMRIIVHSLPTRAVIDTQVQEQLIVELYSK